MSEEVYRQQRPVAPQEIESPEQLPFESARNVQRAAAAEMGEEGPGPMPIGNNPESPVITGKIPPQFKQMMEQQGVQIPASQTRQQQPQGRSQMSSFAQPQQQQTIRQNPQQPQGSFADNTELQGILAKISEHTHQWEPVILPSSGKFYNGEIPGVLHVRPMTGQEEQILATPRYVKKGQAIDMIFEKCIREQINTRSLLAIDRNYLLIFLRGISYTPEYDVEIKCPECSTKFNTMVDLNDLNVNGCPPEFDTNNLSGILPTTGILYKYRLATGEDELEVTRYRQRRIEMWGDQSEDDTLLYRTSLLLENIGGITNNMEIQTVLKRLPINDVSHLRNCINDPPFGVDTKVPMVCPACTGEFEVELPLEVGFFFPRKKKERTQA